VPQYLRVVSRNISIFGLFPESKTINPFYRVYLR
jgi:hypothetical protein